MSENNLTHFDAAGNAVMVDVSGKPVTAHFYYFINFFFYLFYIFFYCFNLIELIFSFRKIAY